MSSIHERELSFMNYERLRKLSYLNIWIRNTKIQIWYGEFTASRNPTAGATISTPSETAIAIKKIMLPSVW